MEEINLYKKTPQQKTIEKLEKTPIETLDIVESYKHQKFLNKFWDNIL